MIIMEDALRIIIMVNLCGHSCRLIIRNAVNASEHDSVIFCGSGTTGAVERLIHILNHPKNLVRFLPTAILECM